MVFYSLARRFLTVSLIVSSFIMSLSFCANAQNYDGKHLLILGHGALLKGEDQRAVTILSKIIQYKGTDKLTLAKAFLKRAVAYRRLGFLTSAINNFNYAEDFGILPKADVRDLLYNRSQSYKLSGQAKAALMDRQTLEMIDRQVVPRTSRQQFAAVKSSPARMAQEQPRRVVASQVMKPVAKRIAAAKQIPLTAPTTTASIVRSPSNSSLEKAHYAILHGQNKQAIKILNKIIADDKAPQNIKAKALLKRGVAYRRSGKVAASITDFTMAKDLKGLSKSESRDLFFNRAKAYKAVGMDKLALKDNQSLQKIDGILPKITPSLSVPTTTASLQGKGFLKGKKRRFVRKYKAVAQPKTLVGHIKKLMKPKGK